MTKITTQQIVLQPEELFFILHMLHAPRIKGLDEAYFFPEDKSVWEARSSTGLELLKQNGWIIPDKKQGRGVRINTYMLLLLVPLIEPHSQLIVQRIIDADRFQIVTYSWAQEYLVEQYRTAEDSYILTDLQQNEAVIDRLVAAFDIPIDTSRHDFVEITLETFQTILATSPEQRLQAWLDVLPIEKQGFASELVTLKRAGILALSQQTPPQLPPQEVALLHDESGNCWSMEARANRIKLQKVDKKRLMEQLKL